MHDILISEREVEHLFNVYVSLSTTDVHNDPDLVARLRKQERLILTIDGAKPSTDSEALWLIRDHLSGEVLLGFTERAATAEVLADKIREVASLGIPITGVATDGEPVVVEAVQLALPRTPHQLCQYHFLDNFAKGVKKLDSELGRSIAQDLKGLNRFEQAAELEPTKQATQSDIKGPESLTISACSAAPAKTRSRRQQYERLCRPRDAAEAEFVRDVCEVARAAVGGSGRPPLETPGLGRAERVTGLSTTLATAAGKKGGL